MMISIFNKDKNDKTFTFTVENSIGTIIHGLTLWLLSYEVMYTKNKIQYNYNIIKISQIVTYENQE